MPSSPVHFSLAMFTHQLLSIGTELSCLQRSFDHVIIAANKSENPADEPDSGKWLEREGFTSGKCSPCPW